MSGNRKGLLSICCLGYNHARFAAENLEAIWASEYKNIEIIVVDDGSKDNSREVLSDLKEKSILPMHLVLQDNTGNIGHNFNVAKEKASGEFITFIALDDVLKTDEIKKCINELMENTHLAFIAPSKISAIDADGGVCTTVPPLALDKMDNPSADDLLELEFNEFGAFYIQGVFFRKEIIDAVGGFDEDIIGDDIVLRTKVFRYIKNNPQWLFKIIHDPTCYYRRHESNISSNSIRQIKIVTQYLQKYWPDRKNPEILIDWFLGATRHLSFQETVSVCAMNQRAVSLLAEPKITERLIKKLKRETSIFRYIYNKERKENARIVTLFSCIKIRYRKKMK